MFFWDIIAYSISGSICFTMAIVLLFIKFNTLTDNIAYQRIKTYLAYSALVEVSVDILILSFLGQDIDFFVLDYFVIPLSYALHLYLMTRAMLELMHSLENVKFYKRLCFIPLAIITLSYTAGYILHTMDDGAM